MPAIIGLLAGLGLLTATASASGVAPVIEKIEVRRSFDGVALFKAVIDPEGSATAYTLYISGEGSEACCPNEVCSEDISVFERQVVSRGKLSASESAKAVWALIGRPREELRVEYWLVATNAWGTSESEVMNLHTEPWCPGGHGPIFQPGFAWRFGFVSFANRFAKPS